ncbi:hypothetical protein BC938DRAFT_481240, partial [Jimgerdemannia flammicorona]
MSATVIPIHNHLANATIQKSLSETGDIVKQGRVKKRVKEDRMNSKQNEIVYRSDWVSSNSEIKCICSCNDDIGTMVQCDTCNSWLHLDYINETKKSLGYHLM